MDDWVRITRTVRIDTWAAWENEWALSGSFRHGRAAETALHPVIGFTVHPIWGKNMEIGIRTARVCLFNTLINWYVLMIFPWYINGTMVVSINGGTQKEMVDFMENATRMDDNWGYPDFRKPPYLHEICPTLFQGSLLLSLLFGSYKFPETHSSCVLDLSISMGKPLHSRLTIEEWTRLGAQQIQSISGNERHRHMYFPANYIWEATIKTSWREGAKSKIDPQLS